MGKRLLTIPNILSFIRIALIPFIIIAYFKHNYFGSFLLILLSGITDVVDGFIARHFNQVSNFGKVLDPIADKLTQVTIVMMLFIDFLDLWAIWVLLIVLFTKELLTLIVAIYMFSGGAKIISAKWWGKVATVCVYSTILLMVLSKYGFNLINGVVISFFAIVATVFLIISMCGYFKVFFVPYEKKQKEKNNA